jgi:hypothetical protein
VLLGAFSFLSNARADDPPWPPLVSVIALDPAAAEEGSDPAMFLAVRVGPANTALTVQYALGGGAENGVDYEPLSGVVIIPAGAYFAPIEVMPIDDYLVEGAESVVVALQQPPAWPPPYIVAWPSVAFGGIADNDLAATNIPPVVTIVRPSDGAVFDSDDDVPIVARAFDHDGRVVTVEFFAGSTSLGIVTNRPILAVADLLNAAEDPLFDLDAALFPDLGTAADTVPVPLPGNLFRFLWKNPPPGVHALTAVATDNDGDSTRSVSVEIKVLETPPQPVVTVRATDPVATEPDPTTDHLDTATFKLHRTGPTNFPLTVFYRLSGTASNGVDYRELPHSVIIPEGERTVEVVVAPLDDLLVEGPEGVVLTIVPPVCIAIYPPPLDCYLVGRAHTARAVIRDNDTPPNRPPVVRLIKPEDGDVFRAPADIRLAALARDFDGYVTTVEFFEGTNSLGIVTNHPTADSVRCPPFTLVWSNVPPGKYVLTAVATDNGGASTDSRPVDIRVVPHVVPPVVEIKTTDEVASEPGVLTVIDPAVFEVTRTGSTETPLLVFYDVGGTAANGVDYQLLSGRVLIPVGARSEEIVVNPLHDLLVEGLETVVVKLEPSPLLSPTGASLNWWYRIGSNNMARAVIRDNDVHPTNLPPRVAIVHPEDGDVFQSPVDIRLAAVAHDPDGWVRTVEFFDGNLSLGIVTNRPSTTGGGNGDPDPTDPSPEQWFRLLWKDPSPGAHVLTAKATDNRGAAARSEPVHIKVLPAPLLPVVTIYATDPWASEGNLIGPTTTNRNGGPNVEPVDLRTATFTVVRQGNTNDELTVFYKLEGTAGNGEDYRKLSGQVVIPAGALRAQIVVDPIDDLLIEPTETVIAKLEPMACITIFPPPPGCYLVGEPNTAVAFIFDNDFNQSPKLEIVQPQNGDAFPAHSDIEIDVVTRDPDGYVWKVEFYANNHKIGEQAVYFFVPPPPGQVQKFSMVWSNVAAGGYVLTAKATDDSGASTLSDPVLIKVVSEPPWPVVTIAAADPLASEPNPITPAFDPARFEVKRTGATGDPLTVHYRISGTASNGVDYRALSGVVTIPSGSPVASIEVMPYDDTLVEGTESVILALLQPPCVLSNAITPDCYLVGQPGRAVAYIRDNDSPPNRPPHVGIVSPPNGAVFQAPVDIRLIAAAGDADGWVTQVEFFAGDKSLGVVTNPAVILNVDPVRVGDLGTDVLTDNSLGRPFVLVWSNVPPGKYVLTAVATDNVGDSTRSRPIEIAVREQNELPVVRIMATDAVAREGTTNTAKFRLHRTGNTNNPLAVWCVFRGTASNGVDYVSLPNVITIPAGRHSTRIVVAPIDDNLPERVETVRAVLEEPPFGAPPTYVIGRPDRAGAIILDNDHPLRSNESLVDGSLHLRLPVPLGLPFRLEASTNLTDWEEVACDINAEDGVSVVDDEKGTRPMRFFRVLQELSDLEDED